MKTIFISHVQKDAPLVVEIAGYLETKGFKCSYNANHARGSIHIGIIKHAIGSHDCLILLLTLKSVDSEELTFHLTEAILNSKPVIIILTGTSSEDFTSKTSIGKTISKATGTVCGNSENVKSLMDIIKTWFQESETCKVGNTIEVFNPFEIRRTEHEEKVQKREPFSRKRKITFSIVLSFCFLLSISYFLFNGFPYSEIVKLDRTPVLDSIGGDRDVDTISGTVKSKYIKKNKIVIYAFTTMWYIQPLDTQPFTEINPSGKWKSATHRGSKYLIMLVEPEYTPATTMKSNPAKNDKVISYITFPKEK